MDIAAAGTAALDIARSLWAQRIVDPPRRTWEDSRWRESREAIDTMIRSRTLGIGWSRCSVLVPAYRHDNDYEWCIAFAARCWRPQGLDAELARIYFASTYRLSAYGRRALAFGTPAEFRVRKRIDASGRAMFAMRTVKTRGRVSTTSTIDEVMAWGPRAGDILTIDSVAGWHYGHHGCLVERVDPIAQVAHTFEGNATGTGPDGTVYQGVVRGVRPLREWRRFYRPGAGDLTGASS